MRLMLDFQDAEVEASRDAAEICHIIGYTNL